MTSHRLLLLGLDEPSGVRAERMARCLFPDITVSRVDSLDAARRTEMASEVEFLLLDDPVDPLLSEAVDAKDRHSLPRWAVMVRGASGRLGPFDVLPATEWEEASLRRWFEAAYTRHRIRRERERMAGDLQTVSRRVCHDLRSPLGAILSVGEALKEVLTEHAPQSVPLTGGILQSVDELDRLLSRVSLLLKASVAPPAKETVVLDTVIARVLLRLEHRIRAQAITVREPDTWPQVHGVPLLLETVWWNLVDNALRHAKSATSLELGWAPEENHFRFWVTDNGCGIASERLANLIQPFHRLHEPNAANGLGLATVQRLVEQHGGTFGCEPAQDRGVRFHFTLPLPLGGTAADFAADPRLV